MSRAANTDYNKYTNEQLSEMINELLKKNIINNSLSSKFTDAIFKRHHDKLNSDDERKQAQRINALQYYYRKKLIKMYDEKEILKVNQRIANCEKSINRYYDYIQQVDDPDVIDILISSIHLERREIAQLKRERDKLINQKKL